MNGDHRPGVGFGVDDLARREHYAHVAAEILSHAAQAMTSATGSTLDVPLLKDTSVHECTCYIEVAIYLIAAHSVYQGETPESVMNSIPAVVTGFLTAESL